MREEEEKEEEDTQKGGRGRRRPRDVWIRSKRHGTYVAGEHDVGERCDSWSAHQYTVVDVDTHAGNLNRQTRMQTCKHEPQA